jgi:hypothetical protein
VLVVPLVRGGQASVALVHGEDGGRVTVQPGPHARSYMPALTCGELCLGE